ncbi:MAG: trypsin-like serine protease [Clostridia bacterium]|nr:trypsin-like serine protease [Clostridia bacterium]
MVSQDEFSIATMTKNVDTGEVTYSTHDYREEIAVSQVISKLKDMGSVSLLEDLHALASVALDGSIIGGSDERTKVTNTKAIPYSAICYVEGELDGNAFTCTAFMISKNVAVTAGHCVYENYKWATDVKVWPGKNGYGLWNNPYGTAKFLTVAAPTYDDAEDANCDWGIIVLNEHIGNDCGWLGFTYDHGSTFPAYFTMTGYPTEYQYYQYTSTDYVTSIEGAYFYHRIDASDGQSGSPIYDSNNIVHGIHVGNINATRNVGIQITQVIYNYFNDYIAAYADS